MLKSVRKYEQLTRLLRREIQEKDFPEQRFHTAKYLMEHYRISQATLTRALQPLYEDGLIYAVSGKGTFVTPGRGGGVARAAAGGAPLYCIFSDMEMFSPISNPTDWFVLRDIIAGIVEAGDNLGWKVAPIPVPADPNQFRLLAKQSGAGFIFTCYDQFEPLIEHCLREKCPYAVYSVHQRNTRRINQLWIDTIEALRKTTGHLIERGHRRIAFVGDCEDSPRHLGYKRALREAGIPYDPALNVFVSGRPEITTAAAEEFLTAHPEADAAACSSDLRALGVVMAARKLGRRIPEFGITGVDNIGQFFPGLPRLTTADLLRRKVGAELVRLAIAARDGAEPEAKEVFAELVIGETT